MPARRQRPRARRCRGKRGSGERRRRRPVSRFEGFLRAVAVVGVEVEDRKPAHAAGIEEPPGSDCDVIEEAEAHGAGLERVMAGRPHEREGYVRSAVEDRLRRADGRARGEDRGADRTLWRASCRGRPCRRPPRTRAAASRRRRSSGRARYRPAPAGCGAANCSGATSPLPLRYCVQAASRAGTSER